jgi:DMSO reductase anchor subunit
MPNLFWARLSCSHFNVMDGWMDGPSHNTVFTVTATGWTRMHHGIKLMARMQNTRSYCILVHHRLIDSLADNSIASSHAIPSVVPRFTVHDPVAEAGVARYQRSATRSKGQFETAKSSATPNHTFTRTCTMISKSVGNFGTMFCYLKRNEKRCMASRWQTFGCLLDEIQV